MPGDIFERVNVRRQVAVAYKPAPDRQRQSEVGRRPAVVFTAFCFNRASAHIMCEPENVPAVLRAGRAAGHAAWVPRGRQAPWTPQAPTVRDIPSGYGAAVPTL